MLRDHPAHTYWDPMTGAEEVIYDQKGLVWQAEETFVRGKWQRYYGFVGKHCVAKVPAEEIEFPYYGEPCLCYGWKELIGGLDCRLTPPGVPRDNSTTSVGGLPLGSPLVATLWLRNRRGADQTLSAVCCRPTPPALLRGLDIKLEYAPGLVQSCVPARLYSACAHDPRLRREWTELDAENSTRLDPGQATTVLAPTQITHAMRIDLSRWFEITRPGCYRAKLVISKESGLGEGETNRVCFSMTRVQRHRQQ